MGSTSIPLRVAGPALAGLLLGGCGLAALSDLWFGEVEGPPLPGDRIAVMLQADQLESDASIAGMEIRLPPPVRNGAWPQDGGYPDHAMHHLAVGDNPEKVWEATVGDGAGWAARLTAQPIVFGGRVFTMDAVSQVSAFDMKTGKRLWETDVLEDDEEGAFGGGLAYFDGRIFVATGFAQVVALAAESGEVLWRTKLAGPLRSAPTVTGGRVFAVSIDNQLHALAVDDGQKLWTHAGITETAGLLGGASPAVAGDVVVVPYSSGELIALRVENGRVIWSDTLATIRRAEAVSTLADIRGKPVIDRGRVFAISHSGRMVSIDLRTGGRAWDRKVGGVNTPWVAGDFIYVLSNDSQLVCLTRSAGRVRWITQLPRYVDPESTANPIAWTGPVLASDRLIVSGSHGEVIAVSPYSGEVIGIIEMDSGVTVPP
ncbi:MAG: PQQ-binding-like beta-propeller repeat protein, partial [Kiloniellales bacterium]